jgi:hypothetical protein
MKECAAGTHESLENPIMTITPGDKVRVITRRLFEDDLRQHFTGVVDESTDVSMRVTGYVWVFEKSGGEFSRRNNTRTRIFSLVDSGLISNVLPDAVQLDSLRYVTDASRKKMLVDGRGFEMNISEFGAQ